MHTAETDIEVIELAAPPTPFDGIEGDVRQWATHAFGAARAQRVASVELRRTPPAANGAGGARGFYWWMLVAALLALALA